MATSNQTPNYNLSQYAPGDAVKFLTNYNQDMSLIDAALKAIHDSDAAKTPLSRTIAGLPLSADLTVAQLIAAGLAPTDPGHTFGGTGYVKLPNGLILEWITFNTPTVAANSQGSYTLTLSHITNNLFTIGNIIPLTSWDWKLWEVIKNNATSVHAAVDNGATAQTFIIFALAIGT